MEQEDKLELVKRFSRNFKKEYEVATIDSSCMHNPLNAFTMFKKLTTDFELLKELVRSQIDAVKEFEDFIKNEEVSLPDEEDLYGAAVGLRRIQATYKLDVKDLADGKINYDGVTHSFPMSTSDCYEMSRILYENEDFQGAKAWIEETIQKGRLEGDNNVIFYRRQLDKINKELHEMPMVEYNVWVNETWEMQASLCRNEFEVPHNISKRFICYMTKSSPFLQLAPIKTEQLYIDPDIWIYHDVISDDEIEHLKQLSELKIERAEHSEDMVRPKNVVDYRSCKHAWIEDRRSKVIIRILQRIRDITGLNVDLSEGLQIVNYGIGGHYDSHYDFFRESDEDRDTLIQKGNRIATILFYLSNVAQGGATVFNELGLSVVPIKNAALYWRNLHPSGEGNIATKHAACPVLRGSKWTLTKWIRELGQEFISPCNLEYQREEDLKEYPKVKKINHLSKR